MAMFVCINATPVQSAIGTRHLISSIMQASYRIVNVNPQMPDHLCTDARILNLISSLKLLLQFCM